MSIETGNSSTGTLDAQSMETLAFEGIPIEVIRMPGNED